MPMWAAIVSTLIGKRLTMKLDVIAAHLAECKGSLAYDTTEVLPSNYSALAKKGFRLVGEQSHLTE